MTKLIEPDIVDRLGHLRALIPPSEARKRWNAALEQNKACNPLEEEVFTQRVIFLLRVSYNLRCKVMIGGKAALDRAINIIGGKQAQFLIPGVGMYLFESVHCACCRS